MKKKRLELTIALLREEAAAFAQVESTYPEPTLYGVTDGKAIGTYLEHKFRGHLEASYALAPSSSAKGIDFPGLGVDMKVTAITQPQSSCPFKSALQKIFGLGYPLLVFVYQKRDDPKTNTAILNILHTVFVEEHYTADYVMTKLIRNHLEAGCNVEDLVGLMRDKNLPLDDVEAAEIAEELLKSPCEQGYLTISNALQWRLQYARVIEEAGKVRDSQTEVGRRPTMAKSKKTAEYGDFQTPSGLAQAVCACWLAMDSGRPRSSSQPAGLETSFSPPSTNLTTRTELSEQKSTRATSIMPAPVCDAAPAGRRSISLKPTSSQRIGRASLHRFPNRF